MKIVVRCALLQKANNLNIYSKILAILFWKRFYLFVLHWFFGIWNCKIFSLGQKGHLRMDLSRHVFINIKLEYTIIIDEKISSFVQARNGDIQFFSWCVTIGSLCTSYSPGSEWPDPECAELFARYSDEITVAHNVSFRSGPVAHRKVCVSFWKAVWDGIRYTTPTNTSNSWQTQ